MLRSRVVRASEGVECRRLVRAREVVDAAVLLQRYVQRAVVAKRPAPGIVVEPTAANTPDDHSASITSLGGYTSPHRRHLNAMVSPGLTDELIGSLPALMRSRSSRRQMGGGQNRGAVFVSLIGSCEYARPSALRFFSLFRQGDSKRTSWLRFFALWLPGDPTRS